jgi:O-antigen/teichoic acid export membrane protein
VKNTPSVKKNFIYSTLYQILAVITPFITAPYISRVLGADGVGVQSYTASVQTYFSMFAALGTVSYGSRAISQARDDAKKRSKLFWEIELMTVFTTAMCLIAWGALILFSSENKIYYMVLTLNLLATMFDISWFFSGLEQFKLIVIRNTVFKLLGVACIFLFVKQKNDLLLYIAIFSVSALLSSLSMWPYLKSFLVKVNPKEFNILPHLKETLVYFIPTIASSVYTVLDKTLIGIITHDSAENGYYQQAEKIINMAKSVVFSSINSVVGVRISYLFAEEKYDEIRRRIENSMNYILFMGFGCMFGIMGVAKNFVPVFFGEGYDNVVTLLYIFSPIIVIIGISNCLGSQYYTPSGRRAQSAKFIIAGSVVNLCLNLVLIPKFNSYGAAVASIAAETVITILYLVFCNGFMDALLLFKIGWKKLLSGLLMMIAVIALRNLPCNAIIKLALQVASGAVVYVLMLIVLRDKWTIEFLRTTFYKLIKRGK